MPLYEVSWTIKMASNNEGAINPPGEAALTAMYPLVRGERVNIYLTTDGGRLAEVSVSQRVSAGDPRTARKNIIGGNAFTSDDGMAALINDATIDVEVSDLTILDYDTGASVLMDKGTYVPRSPAPAPAPSSGRLAMRRRQAAKGAAIEAVEEVVEEVAEEVVEETPVAAPRRRGRPRRQRVEPVVDNATTDQGEEEE